MRLGARQSRGQVPLPAHAQLLYRGAGVLLLALYLLALYLMVIECTKDM